MAAALKGYAGIIVSAMVPGAGGYKLKRDDGTSAAEQPARLVPKGRVVTAFTSISSALIRDPASGEKPTVFTCADDEAARASETALRCALMERRELFDVDLSRGMSNVMPGVMSGILKESEPIGTDIVYRNAIEHKGA